MRPIASPPASRWRRTLAVLAAGATALAGVLTAGLGQLLAFVMGFVGLFWNPLLVFIALLVFLGAGEEGARAQARSAVEGVPVRGIIVRLTDAWTEILARRRANEATGAWPLPVSELLGEMAAAGALNFIQTPAVNRRDALWQVERVARTPGELYEQLLEQDGNSPLEPMTGESAKHRWPRIPKRRSRKDLRQACSASARSGLQG